MYTYRHLHLHWSAYISPMGTSVLMHFSTNGDSLVSTRERPRVQIATARAPSADHSKAFRVSCMAPPPYDVRPRTTPALRSVHASRPSDTPAAAAPHVARTAGGGDARNMPRPTWPGGGGRGGGRGR